ncbi:class I SAM-dependent methyltransferase [Myceligenerans pegani]|uniref:Methyltransferase domain-containing protein n=1 Tax=Myceligenerans pegani TaxID=2776917 RepID=A0ABR9MWN5_9MICO|nr:class I SAM-dependent methyltransferase [Myceligenerans sp. TRM 65318]MBE1875530.1 methyltransferase domain-containing protein [Myceligenerans sp. TRM 65318]MBE3017801.1 methyltransferase domain-containing protein [Myceligenerans sp. TRM 65318]
MRIGTIDELFEALDRTIAEHERGDRTSAAAAGFWERLLRREDHPLSTGLPDEPLTDWHERDLLGDVDGARVLDVGCGNGRNGRWLAERGADVVGVDLATAVLDEVRPTLPNGMEVHAVDILRDPLPAGPFDLIYDSGCFHHLAPHRRITYLQRLVPLLRLGGRYAIVTFSQERQPSPSDRDVLATGDTAGGTAFTLDDLERIFTALRPLELRAVRSDVSGTFGADFLNAALFRR